MSTIRTGLHQSARLRQEMKTNPRLYQAMDLLYMPLLDLQTRLEQELLENPFLELSEPDSEEVDWEEILLDDFDEGGPRMRYEPREPYEPVVVETRHLHDYLRDQVGLLHLSERQLWIAEEIIGNIDDDGLLTCSPQDVVAGLEGSREEMRDHALKQAGKIRDDDERDRELAELAALFAPPTVSEVESVLVVVQSLDPPGVGARGLQECLMIQLSREGREETLAYRIVADHFEGLLGHRWVDVARALEIAPAKVQDAADEIAKLDPKPGRRYAADPDHYVIPDLIVDKIGGEYLVFANDTGLPRLRLSQSYRDVAADKSKFVGPNKEFIANKLNAAQWLIQVIEQRRQTMLKVMRFIVARQTEFFERGVQYLKPLTLREVADHIEMAESTVSRVTNDKYVQSPSGVQPLKFFFSGGLPTVTGEDVSTRGVQEKIRNLISDEDPRRPLTDQALVNLLKSEGIKIARRTVAKYRDQLGLLPARMRKRI
ncbi:MAG: RNA polymerase factor sigma-54 [Gemmatimonadota bacterium]|nr:RNA polymerase factor sigma-54 [Gemmatimonadota bacterium]